MIDVFIRKATEQDIESIRVIYNQGIEDRIATWETTIKDMAYMKDWFENHGGRYTVIVAEYEGLVIGWGSLNPYNIRCTYEGVDDVSLYIFRGFRGKGIGTKILTKLERFAKENAFHKIVLSAFSFNSLGQYLYRKKGYREVGVFKEHGILDGKFVDVIVMEKLL